MTVTNRAVRMHQPATQVYATRGIVGPSTTGHGAEIRAGWRVRVPVVRRSASSDGAVTASKFESAEFGVTNWTKISLERPMGGLNSIGTRKRLALPAEA